MHFKETFAEHQGSAGASGLAPGVKYPNTQHLKRQFGDELGWE